MTLPISPLSLAKASLSRSTAARSSSWSGSAECLVAHAGDLPWSKVASRPDVRSCGPGRLRSRLVRIIGWSVGPGHRLRRSPSAQSPPARRPGPRGARAGRRIGDGGREESRWTSSPLSRRRKTRGRPSSSSPRRGPGAGVGHHAALGQGDRPARARARQGLAPEQRAVGERAAP